MVGSVLVARRAPGPSAFQDKIISYLKLQNSRYIKYEHFLFFLRYVYSSALVLLVF